MDDTVLWLFELGEMDETGHFIGSEHPFHSRLEEINGDVSSDLPPDVSATFSEVVQIGRARDTNAVPIADYFVDQSLAFPI